MIQTFRYFAAILLIALGCLCAQAALHIAPAPRGALTIEQRVNYQRKLEEVYWRHRAAAQNADQSTAAFNKAVPEDVIRGKVDDTLRKSGALEKFWQRPITSAQLTAEVSRVAAQTKAPGILRELWAALDNDPAVIAECLARPLLVERQLSAWYAHDERFHGALRQRIEAELQEHPGAESLKHLTGEYSEHQAARTDAARKSRFGVADKAARVSEDEWQGLTSQLAMVFAEKRNPASLGDPVTMEHSAAEVPPMLIPVGQMSSLQENATHFYVLAVLSSGADEVSVATISWQKQPLDEWWHSVKNDVPFAEPRTGSAEELAAATPELPQLSSATTGADDTWRPTSAPLSERQNHTAVWTGSEMIVWGGFYNNSNYNNYAVTVGSRYNPATDTWALTSTVNGPAWRERHTAVWTGTEMVVWGGYSGELGATNTGARYNPVTDKWTPTPTVNAPTARSRHTAVWTGTRMLVWGGRTGDTDDTTVNTGGSYDPGSNSWTAINPSNAPAARMYHTAIWSGSEMIVWGGYNGGSGNPVNTGGRYNPQSNSWQGTNTSGALSARYAHNAVWTGTGMLVWGGASSFFSPVFFNTGAIYNPSNNTWSAISNTNAPAARDAAMAVWSGSDLIVWGGFDGNNRLRNGGRYNLQANSWQPSNNVGAPAGSVAASAVWTGSEMLVWGGQEPTLAATVNTGARYNPQTDSWLPITNPQNAGARTEHPAVWTGAEMIVWGSYTLGTAPTDTGARYYPATDSWLTTSLVNVPKYRYAPTAIWTGSEMLVWGGCSDSFCFNRLNTGGRYNPATDSWRPTTTTGAAEARYWSGAVWTGTEMIVWGGCDAQTCGPGGNSDPEGLNNGGLYNPETDSWRPLNTAGAPAPRWFHAVEWTGSEMVVWGGLNGHGPHGTGGRYNLATETWTPTSLTNAPIARGYVHSVWTGSRMIVWGGNNSLLDQDMNSGGLYDPAADSWSATSLTNAPSPRIGHSLIWTGEEMIAWGGCSGPNCQNETNTGGRYNPQTDIWRNMSTVEAPTPRDVHSAIWTGKEMIVFGGEPCARCEPVFDTGGRYAAAVTPRINVSSLTHTPEGHFIISGRTTPGASVNITSSPDLQTPFTLLTTVTANASGLYRYEDVSASSAAQRYYHATLVQ